MACSRMGYGKCSRCGAVNPTHFSRQGPADREDKERKQIQHAFFQARKKPFPSKAQLKLWKEIV